MKIALIGSAGSIHLAPFENQQWKEWRGGAQMVYPPPLHVDENWQVWGCSPGAAMGARRADVWFEVHRWEPGQAWFQPAYLEFLRTFAGPVYVGGALVLVDGNWHIQSGVPLEAVPNQVPYPIDSVDANFSSYFLSSSLALMAAVAILTIEQHRADNPDHDWTEDAIGFWGVDMAANEEYGYQRPGCHHFMLEAARRGIGVYIPPESCLMRPMPVYGLSEWDDQYIKMTARARELNGRVSEAAKQRDAAQATIQSLAGALDALNYQVNTWSSKLEAMRGGMNRLTPDRWEHEKIRLFRPVPVVPPPADAAPPVMPPVEQRTVAATILPKKRRR